MDYKRLFLLVEGDDDERFIKQIITPLFEENYKYIKPWKYSQKKKNKIIYVHKKNCILITGG